MDRTLREHIEGLETRIRRLADRSMQSEDLSERNRIESEIRAANLALAQYKSALAVEQALEKE